ncbi:MAG: hypothetical protein ACMUHX_09570 [bacterium]
MDNFRFLKIWTIVAVLALGLIFTFGSVTQAQIFPTSYYYTNPLYYSGYGYFNSINGYLLGYAPFTPFLTPNAAYSYNALGIPTYPYFGSPYQTTFPYTTLPGTPIPYARFDYPTYAYGSPDFYLSWVLLQ